jgi:hypothetical protein
LRRIPSEAARAGPGALVASATAGSDADRESIDVVAVLPGSRTRVAALSLSK